MALSKEDAHNELHPCSKVSMHRVTKSNRKLATESAEPSLGSNRTAPSDDSKSSTEQTERAFVADAASTAALAADLDRSESGAI